METALRMTIGVALVTSLPFAASAQDRRDTPYRATLYRAAPGRLLDLIDALGGPGGTASRSRLMLRHSQGDHWDLMVLERAPERLTLSRAAAPQGELVAWREETFVHGPDLASREEFWRAGLYHVEMFHALPGKRAELLRQREMENHYAATLGQPENAIFERLVGGSWDCFTIGPYRGLKHFAEREDLSADETDAAARAAGFEGGDRIGTYLRSLILDHHDTLASPVR